jgi:hypothetical protein
MNDKDGKPEGAAKPDDKSTEDLARDERREVLRRSGEDRRDPNTRHMRVPDRRKNGDRRIVGRRKSDLK